MSPIGSINTLSWIQNPEKLPVAKDPAAASAGGLAQGLEVSPGVSSSPAAGGAGIQPASFSKVLENAVQEVNSKMQAADVEKGKLLTGETSNVHQAMIAVQESSVAFSLMVEVRNKLVDSYQELMRMQV